MSSPEIRKAPYKRAIYDYVPKVPKEEIDAFLTRTLPNNYDYLKTFDKTDLDKLLYELDPVPAFKIDPFTHQKIMFLIGMMMPTWEFFAFPGAGKTHVALNLINYRKTIGKVNKTLVLIPDIANFKTWTDECTKQTPDLKPVIIHGKNKQERLDALSQDGDIYVSTYMGLQVLLSQSNDRGRLINTNDVMDFASNFDCMVLDESIMTKNPKSLTFQVCNVLSKNIPYKYGLTGRPFGRQPLDLWAQLFIIDGGATLGRKLALFREAFFNHKKTHFGTEWKLKPELEATLHQVLKNRSIKFSQEECNDLPKLTNIIVRIPISTDAKPYYKQVAEEFISTHDKKNETAVPVIKNHFIKLRQICSGFLRYKPEGSETDEDIVFDTHKDTILEQLVDNLPEGSKMIVFHEFTFSGKRITSKLRDMHIGHRWLYGGTPDKTAVLEDFTTNPKTRVLVLNSHSGAMGLNLQCANFVVFYESPVSSIVRSQAEKRAHRTGQTKPVFIYDLVTERSIEERVLQFLNEGDDLYKAIIEGRISPTELVGPVASD